MAVCNVCSGAGGSHGNYETCYRCGGSGHGGFTNVPCASCGGSGQAGTRAFNTCLNCGGSGRVADLPVYGASTGGKRNRTAAKRQSKPSPSAQQSGGGSFGWLIFFAGTVIGGVYLGDNYTYAEPWHPFALAAVPSAIVGVLWKVLLILAVLGVAALIYFGS